MKIKIIIIAFFSILCATLVFADMTSHQEFIEFTEGVKFFKEGDSITITQVKSTSPDLKTGDTVTVKGRYTLSSAPRAALSLYATEAKGPGRSRTFPAQRKAINKGEGEFDLSITLPYDGYLHVTFYSITAGKPFGGVYFGTAKQMEDIMHWNPEDWYTAK
jgi:hypothetical protein